MNGSINPLSQAPPSRALGPPLGKPAHAFAWAKNERSRLNSDSGRGATACFLCLAEGASAKGPAHFRFSLMRLVFFAQVFFEDAFSYSKSLSS